MQDRLLSWPHRLAMAMALLLLAASHSGWLVEPLTNDVDASWSIAMTYARLQGLQFGTDIVFTYGPFGYLSNHYIPLAASRIVLLSWCALTFGAALLITLVRVTRSTTWGVALLALLWLMVRGEPLAAVMLMAPALLAWFGDDERDDERTRRRLALLLHLSMVALALASLVKFSFAVQALLTVAAVGARSLQRRSLPWVWLTYPLALLLLWLAAGQSLGNLPAFARTGLDLISGYDAMSRYDRLPRSQACWMSAWCVALLALSAAAAWLRWRRWGAVIVLLIAAYEFMLFKHGLVRHDRHILGSVWDLLALSVTMSAVAWCSTSVKPLAARGMAWATAATLLVALASSNVLLYQASVVYGTQAMAPDTISLLLARACKFHQQLRQSGSLLLRQRDLATQWDQQLRDLRQRYPLPALPGRVDIVGDQHQALATVYGYHYTPRPILQSYSAYTPLLQQLNFDFYQRPQIPEHVLIGPMAIDQRWPALCEGPVWPLLMARYDPVELVLDKTLLHLRAREQARRIEITPLSRQEVEFGQTLALPTPPAGHLLWARVHLSLTPAGRAVRLLYKTPQLQIHATTADGRQITRRFIADMAREGFVLSPYIYTADDFAHAGWSSAQSTFWPQASVSSVAWTIAEHDAPAWCYENRIKVELCQLSLAR